MLVLLAYYKGNSLFFKIPKSARLQLINYHLLVRSGMNYVVYWDIFRDYLAEERVPYIPWARTFQRGPATALKALPILGKIQPATAPELGKGMKIKEVPCINLLADLVALQLVELDTGGRYCIAKHLDNVEPTALAKFVQGQFRRHVVVKEIVSKWEKTEEISTEGWMAFFSNVHPRTSELSKASIRMYAGNLKNWLVFAGILEQKNNLISRPGGEGSGMGILPSAKLSVGTFLGSASPKKLEELLRILYQNKEGVSRATLEGKGLRNAIYDGMSLGLLFAKSNKAISLKDPYQDLQVLLKEAKLRVLQQKTIGVIASSSGGMDVGSLLQQKIGSKWQRSSVKRYVNGLRIYLKWAKTKMVEQGSLF